MTMEARMGKTETAVAVMRSDLKHIREKVDKIDDIRLCLSEIKVGMDRLTTKDQCEMARREVYAKIEKGNGRGLIIKALLATIFLLSVASMALSFGSHMKIGDYLEINPAAAIVEKGK